MKRLIAFISILMLVSSAYGTATSVTIYGTNKSNAQTNVTCYGCNQTISVQAWNTSYVKNISVHSRNGSGGDAVSFNISNITGYQVQELKVNGTVINAYQAGANGMLNFTYTVIGNRTLVLSPAMNANGYNSTWGYFQRIMGIGADADILSLGSPATEGGNIVVYRDTSGNKQLTLDGDSAQGGDALDLYGLLRVGNIASDLGVVRMGNSVNFGFVTLYDSAATLAATFRANIDSDSLTLGSATHEGGDITVYRDASGTKQFYLDADAAGAGAVALTIAGGINATHMNVSGGYVFAPTTQATNATLSRGQDTVYQNGYKPMFLSIVTDTNAVERTIKTDANNPPTTVVSIIDVDTPGYAFHTYAVILPRNFYMLDSTSTVVISYWTEWT